MLAVWVDQLLGFASEALSAIRQKEHYPDFMIWVRAEGGDYFNGDFATAQALAPVLWSQTPLERLAFFRRAAGRAGAQRAVLVRLGAQVQAVLLPR